MSSAPRGSRASGGPVTADTSSRSALRTFWTESPGEGVHVTFLAPCPCCGEDSWHTQAQTSRGLRTLAIHHL